MAYASYVREAREPHTPVRRRSLFFSLVPDLLIDCSRVLEYAKIRTVLQFKILGISIRAQNHSIYSVSFLVERFSYDLEKWFR